MNDMGHVFWLFGLSGAGKTTLACILRRQLLRHSFSPPLMLDGDRLRLRLCKELGYSEGDRTENLRRASEVARVAIESGIDVIASFITPREFHRQMIEDIVGHANISFIYVSASVEICRTRDVKRLYSKAAQGTLSNMSGIDSVFDPPSNCDLVLDTVHTTESHSGAALFDFAINRLRRRCPGGA